MANVKNFISSFKSIDEKRYDQLRVSESASSGYRFGESIDGKKAEVDFLSIDSLSSKFLRIRVEDAFLKDLGLNDEQLERVSNLLCEKISFLSESFKLIENDRKNKRVQIRSYPPYVKEQSRSYFELLLDLNEAVLTLSRKETESSGHITENVPFVLSDELFERLLTVLTGLKNASAMI
ncbi:MAG: hypothetical protein AB7T22_01515 [Calditrichaceae bacterium]